MTRSILLLIVVALAIGCRKPESASATATDPATRRQLDSVVARSPLPGARAVGRALDVLGQSETRAAAIDSIR